MTDKPVAALVERARKGANKALALALIFDERFPNDPNPEVQHDLRGWAGDLDALASALEQALEERDRERENFHRETRARSRQTQAVTAALKTVANANARREIEKALYAAYNDEAVGAGQLALLSPTRGGITER